jgi:hypothetical protein
LRVVADRVEVAGQKVEVKVEVAMQQGGSKGGTRWNSELGTRRKLHNPMDCVLWSLGV